MAADRKIGGLDHDAAMQLRPMLAPLVLLGCLLVSCGEETGAGGSPGSDSTPAAYKIVPSGQRSAAPSLTGSTVSGAPLALGQFRGKVVVVNFWAAWCGPCRAESPVLARVLTATSGRGAVFVGVDEKDSRSAAATFVKDQGVTYASVFDPDGSRAAGWPGAPGLPYTFILDRHGKIAVRIIGGVTGDLLEAAVLHVIGESQ
jgi:thiol-disulfide isomerase/thioredoxin